MLTYGSFPHMYNISIITQSFLLDFNIIRSYRPKKTTVYKYRGQFALPEPRSKRKDPLSPVSGSIPYGLSIRVDCLLIPPSLKRTYPLTRRVFNSVLRWPRTYRGPSDDTSMNLFPISKDDPSPFQTYGRQSSVNLSVSFGVSLTTNTLSLVWEVRIRSETLKSQLYCWSPPFCGTNYDMMHWMWPVTGLVPLRWVLVTNY